MKILVIISFMKTKELTRGAMVCAIYGVLLFLNQQTALTIETSMNWVFAFPILIFTSMYGASIGSVVAIAMVLMTFLFGGFTTWFYSWTAILIGFIYGIGVKSKWKHTTNFAITAILSIGSAALIIYLWAGIFGYDLATEFASIMAFMPSIHLRVLVFIFVLLLGILQAFCIHMIALMVGLRMNIEMRPLGNIRDFRSPRWVGLVSVVVLVAYFLLQNMVNSNTKDIIQIITIMDMMVLDFFGVIYFMNRSIAQSSRNKTFIAIIGCFIPVINMIWVGAGLMDCLFQLRTKMKD